MKSVLLIFAITLSASANAQCFENATSIRIRHMSLRTDHRIPMLLISNASFNTRNDKKSQKKITDTSTQISTTENCFHNLLDIMSKENYFIECQSEYSSKEVEIAVSYYKNEKVLCQFFLTGKDHVINYFTMVVEFLNSQKSETNLRDAFTDFISDVKNARNTF